MRVESKARKPQSFAAPHTLAAAIKQGVTKKDGK